MLDATVYFTNALNNNPGDISSISPPTFLANLVNTAVIFSSALIPRIAFSTLTIKDFTVSISFISTPFV